MGVKGNDVTRVKKVEAVLDAVGEGGATSLSVIFFAKNRYRRLPPKLFCPFLHKSRRDGTAGRLVFRHVHTKTRNPNFSTPENTKIDFASRGISPSSVWT